MLLRLTGFEITSLAEQGERKGIKMSLDTSRICTPQPTYVIFERVGPKLALPAKFGVGPGLRQVQRQVYQVCDLHDVLFQGQRSSLSPWKYLLGFLLPGRQITTRSTGRRELMLVYSGFRNLVRPLPPVMGTLIPSALTREHDLGVPPSPFVLGEDPIPEQQLFGDREIEFVSPGGEGDPVALAVYRAHSGTLEAPPPLERARLIDELLKRGAAKGQE